MLHPRPEPTLKFLIVPLLQRHPNMLAIFQDLSIGRVRERAGSGAAGTRVDRRMVLVVASAYPSTAKQTYYLPVLVLVMVVLVLQGRMALGCGCSSSCWCWRYSSLLPLLMQVLVQVLMLLTPQLWPVWPDFLITATTDRVWMSAEGGN